MALTDNLVSYWKLDETSGTRADSVVASGNDLTDNNTVLYATGQISNAADFEIDNDEYLEITDASQTGLDITGDLSVSFWAKLETAPDTDKDYYFFSKYAGAGHRSYELQYHDASGTKSLRFLASGNGTAFDLASFTQTLTVGTWYHIVVIYDASAPTCEIYINNSSLGSTAGSLSTSIFSSDAPFQLGENTSDGTAGNGYDGLIDEFGIWNRTLTSDEVASLYNSGNGLTYPFTVGGATTPTLALLGVG